MAIQSELREYVRKTLREGWATRDGRVVPDTDGVALGNTAVKIDATVLYADLARSTQMVASRDWYFAAEVYKSFLYATSRLIRYHGGVITAFDGDRVMGVYLGGSKNTNAAKTALRVNWAATKLVQPLIEEQYPNSGFRLKHRVGVDTSQIHVIRAGIRGSNDLIWLSDAANNAAKMAALPTTYASYVSAAVYSCISKEDKYDEGGDALWRDLGASSLGYRIYGSNWWWSP